MDDIVSNSTKENIQVECPSSSQEPDSQKHNQIHLTSLQYILLVIKEGKAKRKYPKCMGPHRLTACVEISPK